jgi:hypothetical protein
MLNLPKCLRSHLKGNVAPEVSLAFSLLLSKKYLISQSLAEENEKREKRWVVK